MNLSRQLVFRGLRFYARSHLGSLLGVTVAGAVLVGALAVGDCVSESLRDMALARVGRIDFALAGRDRFFRDALAEDLRPAISNGLSAAALQLPGIATSDDGTHRVNHAQILGVGDGFWALAQKPPALPPDWTNGVVLNAPLALRLGAKVGDTLLLRVQKPSLLSLEVPISPQEDVASGFRLPVKAVVSEDEMGRFSLQANQVPPLNAFVPLSVLQEKTSLPGRANLLLTGAPRNGADMTNLLREHWQLADAQCELHPVPGGLELRSDRVFIDTPVARAAETPAPGPELVLTYFVNELRDGARSTPYSMVTAADAPLVPAEMHDDEIIVNQWLADDLQAKPGDEVALTYYVPGTTNRLVEKSSRFRIRTISPMEGITADRTLMPDFPGIAKAESTANWDAGFPIDLGKIRPKDEAYWKSWRGTPKAFVTLAAGQRIWGNRFGDLTAVRFPTGADAGGVGRGLLLKLNPNSLGLAFAPVREGALAAAAGGQAAEFGGLVLGFSFFLIVSALILLALLFQFGVEKRAEEIGILLALGWPPRRVRRLLLGEGAVVAVAGGLLGVAGGVLYAMGILWGLTTLWSAAVANSELRFHVTFSTLATGVFSTVAIGVGVMWFALRSQTKRSARELLEQGNELEAVASMPRRGRRWAGWIAGFSLLGAVALAASAIGKRDDSAVETFFESGSLLLIAGIAGAAVWFRSLAEKRVSKPLTLGGLGVRGCARRPKRSLATVALLASGSFLIIAVEANKLDANQQSGERSSGTGGFALIGESTLPVTQDLNAEAGRDFFSLDAKQLSGVSVAALRVRDGDDASCLNLNQAQTPRLLGVKPALFDSRHAFTFTALADKAFSQKPWMSLEKSEGSDTNEIPAIGDEATITWALGKKIGDTVDYTDEHGNAFKLRLVGAVANSVLQGSLIIDESEFVKRFPGGSGYRMFLIDAPPANATAVSAALARGLRDRGLELTPAVERLNAFNAVQNTYLNTFQALGGLGLLLGSAGMGAVALRNALERRGELAVLLAVGFRRRSVRGLMLGENAVLQCLGLLLGVAAALLAVLPVLLSPGARISFESLALTLGLVFVCGFLWIWAAARLALRGELLDALRNE